MKTDAFTSCPSPGVDMTIMIPVNRLKDVVVNIQSSALHLRMTEKVNWSAPASTDAAFSLSTFILQFLFEGSPSCMESQQITATLFVFHDPE